MEASTHRVFYYHADASAFWRSAYSSDRKDRSYPGVFVACAGRWPRLIAYWPISPGRYRLLRWGLQRRSLGE